MPIEINDIAWFAQGGCLPPPWGSPECFSCFCLCGGRGVPLPYGVRVVTASVGRDSMWGCAPLYPPMPIKKALQLEGILFSGAFCMRLMLR